MTPDPSGERQSPAERRLAELLAALGAHPPAAPVGLGDRIVRSAGWQGAARPYLGAAGGMFAAAGDAMRILLRPRMAQ